MANNRIADLLNYSRPCSECEGTGKIKDEVCKKCEGNGVQLDNRVAETVLKYYPGDRAKMAQCVKELYEIQGVKLEEAYVRGKADGKVGEK